MIDSLQNFSTDRLTDSFKITAFFLKKLKIRNRWKNTLSWDP